MANGKVCTGFSLPVVAKYTASGTTVTYSDGMDLARGVDVSISPESSDDNIFFANNVAAESAPGTFTGGEVTLTVDGLKTAAERLILGLPEATGDWIDFGDDQVIPYVGIGFVVRYMEDGVTSYTGIVLRKCRFQMPETSAATQEEEIDWQTQELTANIFRDDTAKHNWRSITTDQTTEAAAYALVKTKLGITSAATT